MNILVVNDDGIDSPGIAALAEVLSDVGHVYMCAPDGQRSAKSHGITLGGHVTVTEIQFPYAEKAWKTSGTPADCTKIGLQFCEKEGAPADIVFSGINMGGNVGSDTIYSGTVGAAMEGALSGVASVAVSVNSHNATHFEGACCLAKAVIPLMLSSMSPSTVININTPDLPKEEIKGVRTAFLGKRYYSDKFELLYGNTYQLQGEPIELEGHPSGSDTALVLDGYATITPLRYDFTDEKSMNTVEEWSINI